MRSATAVIVFLMLLAACVPNDPDGEGAEIVTTTTTPTKSTQVTVDTTSPTPPTTTTITTTTTPNPTTTAESPKGTRQNPLDPRTTVRVGDWEVTYLGAVLDGTGLVMEENQFNDPPLEGRQFVLFQFEGTYVGEDSGLWWIDLTVSVLGSAANTFGGSGNFDDECGVIPDDIDGSNETFPGGQITGNECVSVPADQIDGALVFIEAFTFGDDNRTFYRVVP